MTEENKKLEIVPGLRFGVGRGRFIVERIEDHNVLISYNRKAGTKPEHFIGMPKECVEDLLRGENLELRNKRLKDQVRHYRESRDAGLRQMTDLEKALNLKAIKMMEEHSEVVAELKKGNADKNQIIHDKNKELAEVKTNLADCEKDLLEMGKSNEKLAKWLFFALIGNLILFGGFAVYIKFFL